MAAQHEPLRRPDRSALYQGAGEYRGSGRSEGDEDARRLQVRKESRAYHESSPQPYGLGQGVGEDPPEPQTPTVLSTY